MLVEVIRLSKAYRTGWLGKTRRMVLQDISLVLDSGESIGVTGDSGAGKTTLGFVLTGMLAPDAGAIRYKGSNIWTAPPALRRQVIRKFQMVFQHPETTFNPRWPLRKSLAEPFRLMNAPVPPGSVSALAKEVGVDPSALERRPRQLSGGELQRLALARIMALRPEVVVLDEPTAMLDALTQARIMGLLERFQRRTGVGYVLFSHDRALVDRFCRRIYRLEHGRFV